MTRRDLLYVWDSDYLTNQDRKEIAKRAGYSGVDSGLQGLRKYLGALTIQTDDKNVKAVMYNYLGHGRFQWICEELEIKLEYQDLVEEAKRMALKLNSTIKKMNYEDAKIILGLINI